MGLSPSSDTPSLPKLTWISSLTEKNGQANPSDTSSNTIPGSVSWWPWPSKVETAIPAEFETAVGKADTTIIAGSIFALGGLSAVVARRVYVRRIRRITNSDWVTPFWLAPQKRSWIKGKVTSVGDADNFRLYHTPGLGWSWPLKFRRVPREAKALVGKTIHIRLAGIDAPEGPHYGKQAQPSYQAAFEWLQREIEGKMIWVQLLTKDHYGRVVGSPHVPYSFTPGWFSRGYNLGLKMVNAGHAEVYTKKGAVYGALGKEAYLAAEAEARAARKGMWALKGIETPAEYKNRMAAEGYPLQPKKLEEEPHEELKESTTSKSKQGWLKRFFNRN